jgi:RNA polymerase sigma-70 factor (ECF subfamily)
MDSGGLRDAFLRGVGDARRQEASSADDLAGALDRYVAEVRLAWPELRVEETSFVAHIAGNLPEHGTLAECLAQLRVAEACLAFACGTGDLRAMQILEERYFLQVDHAWHKIRGTGVDIEDARQLFREKLFVSRGGRRPKILQYAALGDLRNWLRVAATRMLADLAKKSNAETPADDDFFAALPATGNDPQDELSKHAYRSEVREALGLAAASLSTEERNLLRFSFVDALSIDAIARIQGVHRATAARRVARARETLLLRLRQALTDKLRVRGHELDSLLRLVESQIDVTLERYLREPRSER